MERRVDCPYTLPALRTITASVVFHLIVSCRVLILVPLHHDFESFELGIDLADQKLVSDRAFVYSISVFLVVHSMHEMVWQNWVSKAL